MRTKSALDTALLASPNASRATYCKVELDRDGAGTWVDLSDWNGLDFVRAVNFGESVNIPAWTATVSFALYARDNPALSLSPWMANSVINSGGVLCRQYRRLRISTATVPVGDPRPASFNEVFLGRVDSVRVAGQTIELVARDQAGVLQDRFLKTEVDYGSDTPSTATANELQEIIQNILDDHYNTASDISGTASAPRANKLSARTTDGAPFQLYSANGTAATPWNASDDTGWSLRRFIATKATVWQWIQRLSEMIGYRLRFRWHSGSGVDAFVLVLEEPDRSSPSTVLTIDPQAGQCAIQSVALDIQDVRNTWHVGYALNGGASAAVVATDATSITTNGERYAEAMEGSASQIDTATEAQAMADALLSDTKDPVATVQVTLPYLWYVETNDMVQLNKDDIFLDSNQTLCCVARGNSIVQGGPAMTTLTLQGALQTGPTRVPQRVFANPRTTAAVKSVEFNKRRSMVPNSDFSQVGNE